MLHTFHWYAVETSYSVKGANNLLSHNQSCEIVAGWNATMKFLLINHFAGSALGLPKLRNARRLNQRDVLEERITTCTKHLGMRPNLIAVDFWSVGDLPAVVQEQNRVRALERAALGGDDHS
jgi:mannose/fructose-specific phosphotransferase system component IIA